MFVTSLAHLRRVALWNATAFAIAASPAAAQQSTAITALQITTAVSGMALELEQAKQQIAQLQRDLATSRARVRELETKPAEPPKEE